jgi:transcriptional regulator with XRE-family HTH domain
MISICQIKAARVLLDWTASELSEKAGVGVATIRRYETQTGLPQGNFQKVMKLKDVLETAGIEFTGDPLLNPGVTLHLHKGHDNE